MPRIHRAAWVLPMVGPPIRDGWIAVDAGRIVAVGGPEPRPFDSAQGRHDLVEGRTPSPEPRVPSPEPRIAILPGLVNAHTHLELSWMRGQIPPGDAMPAWAARLIRLRLERVLSLSPLDEARGDSEPVDGSKGGTSVPRQEHESIVEAIAEARASGTSLVGDITNNLAAWAPLAVSDLSAAVFLELIGFNADSERLVADAVARLAILQPRDSLRPSIVPHAPYSVSPDLFRAIARSSADRAVSVHMGESPEEVRFLKDGTGPWRELLDQVGAWNPRWVAPACGPVEYIDRLGLVTDRLVAVHGVQLTDGELRQLANAGATVVTCPRSNRWTGAGVPPIERFYASGVNVAIGTDSLASVEDLNMFAEMAAVRKLAPAIAPRDILYSATHVGARALGFGHALGSIEPGKRADLLAVHIPAGVEDVEEYLVGGISPSDVSWLARD
jgi:aminodeoxyfutalosine deaminase